MEEFRCDMAVNAVQADQTPSQMYENKYQLLSLQTTGKFTVNCEKPDNVTFLQKTQKTVPNISSPEHTIRSSCSEADRDKLIRFDDSIPTFALGLRNPPPIFGSNFVGEASFYVPPPLESVSDKPIQQAAHILSSCTDKCEDKIKVLKGGYPQSFYIFICTLEFIRKRSRRSAISTGLASNLDKKQTHWQDQALLQ